MARKNFYKDHGLAEIPLDVEVELVLEFEIDKLIIDERVQREERPGHVKALSENWHPAKVGILSVSAREDGTYALMDGRHRVAAAKANGVTTLRADVFRGLSLAQEASYHVDVQSTREMDTKPETWNMVAEAGVVPHARTSELLAQLDPPVKFGNTASGVTISCAGTLERILKSDVEKAPEAIAGAVVASRAIFGANKDAVNGEILGGLAFMLLHQPELATPEELGDVLARKLDVSAVAFSREARSVVSDHNLGSATRPAAAAYLFANAWNLGRKKSTNKYVTAGVRLLTRDQVAAINAPVVDDYDESDQD